ncbi:MAG: 2TM domain-containing protein [Lysobacterales bacterium]
MNEEQAKERVKELKDFYTHLSTYVAVNLFLFALNMVTGPDPLWFVFPLMGWGIAIIIHAWQVFGTSAQWESRKMEELTGLKSARDDISALAERTEALVTIMSGVNWESIDPALLDTRQSLVNAQQKIAQIKETGDSGSQADVEREIEKLEAFVTSSKFDYYDLAAEQKKPS